MLPLITFIYCLFTVNSLCDGHWTRIWPSRYDREHLTTANHGEIQPNRAFKLISEKTIMQNPLKCGQFNLELDFVSLSCHIKGRRSSNFCAPIERIYCIFSALRIDYAFNLFQFVSSSSINIYSLIPGI